MFVFNGISSDDMSVIAEEEHVFITKASQRYEQIDIEGKNGAIFEENGYSVVNKTIKIQIMDSSKIDKIMQWLNGVGTLIYKNRKTIARFYNEIEPVRDSIISVADVMFIRNPFWNKACDKFVKVNDDCIYNYGTIYSEPILKLEKKEEAFVDFSVNGIRYKYTFNDEEYVLIDSEEQTVEYEGLNRNRQIEMGYQYPLLNVGKNIIKINSGDADISFIKKDRWL